jgi:bacterioferritin (cytochrome b1)
MTAPAAVIDALNGLLEAELNSVFRFMGEGSPYLSRANSEIRRPLTDMVQAGQRRAMELADAIDRLGGIPVPGSIQPEEQYLAFLTLKFLLPKLADAKKLIIRRYENAIRAIQTAAGGDVLAMLRGHIAEMQSELQLIEKAAADVIAKK